LADARREGYKTELEGVRAPLGVILYLIRRDNLDIYDIPIARITREYLEYLDLMEKMEIDLAGEFFVLAATLMRIKAQLLLRKDDDTEEDPRTDLVRSLIEYKKMVEAARSFKELEGERRNIFTRPVPDLEKSYREEPVIDLSLYHLMKAFQEIVNHIETASVREIELEEYTIEEKIIAVLQALREDHQVEFKDLFASSSSKMELIVTLMALLELIKHTQVKVAQDSAFGSIWIYRAANFGRPMGTPEDWDAQPIEPQEITAPGAASSPAVEPETVGAPALVPDPIATESQPQDDTDPSEAKPAGESAGPEPTVDDNE
jgi:segregation and condensation protein A